ncbi:MAG: mechanosensitive ion channel family protein [Gammaproteobacteria bacterium]|nr:mechanosensitive ion channel family protein [Gammaproteobacteria bacterium]NNF60511.1 mechanosensitive ion channel family protein [Gammaproteobacteria bacterium]
MNLTPELQALLINIATISGEVLALIAVFVILNFIVGRVTAVIVATPALAGAGGIAGLLQKNLRRLLIFLAVIGSLAIVGINLYWMYLGHYLPDHSVELFRSIPREFWVTTAMAAAKAAALVVLAAVLLRYLRRLVAFLCGKAKNLDNLRANDEAIEKLFGSLQLTITVSVWLTVFAVAAAWLGLPAAVPAAILLTLRIFLIISVGVLIWRAVGALVDSVDAVGKSYVARTRFTDTYDRLRPLVPVLRRSIEYVVMVTVATLVIMQVEAIANLAEWGPRVIQVIGIVFMARVVKELAVFLLEETMLRAAGLTPQQKQRRATLVPLFGSIVTYAIYFIAGVMILKIFGIDPTPILAGAGIAGLAVGLGAQNLINDMVSGFFILFEEHFLVGDFVRIEEAEGRVESIDLRTTRIRDNAGRHHIIRNGQINDLIHYSKEFTNAVVEVGVAYESDLNKVFEVLKNTGKQLQAENDMVLEPTSVKGLDNFGESDMMIRTVTRVKPGCHLPVERDLRKRIKDAFDANDIEIPYARRVLINKSEPSAAPA